MWRPSRCAYLMGLRRMLVYVACKAERIISFVAIIKVCLLDGVAVNVGVRSMQDRKESTATWQSSRCAYLKGLRWMLVYVACKAERFISYVATIKVCLLIEIVVNDGRTVGNLHISHITYLKGLRWMLEGLYQRHINGTLHSPPACI